jgi:hypothetical protein
VVEIAPQIESFLNEGSHFYRLDFGPVSAVSCLMDQMGPLAALLASLVLLGTAGALDDEVSIGDVVIRIGSQ